MGDFQESDVIWADHHPVHDPYRPSSTVPSSSPHHSASTHHPRKESLPSCPVRIPPVRRTWKLDFHGDTYGEEDEGGEMVPPHETVARRIAGKMAFSVCTGNGRTLKGRDLSKVRNSVLRMTGFLEG